MLPTKTKRILSKVKSPTIYDVLDSVVGSPYYDKYQNNAHKTKKFDVEGLEKLCESIYIVWGKNLMANIDMLNEPFKTTAMRLKTEKVFSPSSIRKNRSKTKTPFYDFLYEKAPKLLGSKKTLPVELQTNISILPDEDLDSFMHVFGHIINYLPIGQIESRLYLNLQAENIPSFAHLAYKKCIEKRLPFYFKFDIDDSRNDPFLFYSSFENLPKYVELIEEIKNEYPNLFTGTEKINNKLGVLNGYIGYGDEPSSKLPSKGSYSEIRGNLFKSIKKDLNEEMKNIFNSNNKKQPFMNNLSFEEYLSVAFEKYLDTCHISTNLNIKDPAIKKDLYKKLQTSFMRNFSEYLLSGKTFDTVHSVSTTANFSSKNFVDYLLKNYPQSFNTPIEKRAFLVQCLFFDSPNKTNHNEKELFSICQELVLNGLKKELSATTSSNEIADINKYMSAVKDAPKNEIGKAVVKIAAANFIQKGYLTINGLKYQYVFPDNILSVYENFLGKHKIDKIIANSCDKWQCSVNNICFNKDTEKELKYFSNSLSY